ncbi:unnamed protein product [Symbiodinium sp. CCMP2592]|nr:unnamed protein product [Symbiodinium sp. CCMP2592]
MEVPGSTWPPPFPDTIFSDEQVASMCKEAAPSTPRTVKTEKRRDRPSPESAEKPARSRLKQEPDPHVSSESDEDLLRVEAMESDMVAAAADSRSKRPKVQADSKQVRKAAKKKELQKRGAQQAAAAGVSYNGAFQSIHAKLKCANTPGHWQEFCKQLASNGTLKCAACRDLRNRVLEGSEALVPAPAAEPSDMDAAAKAPPRIPAGKGRPSSKDEVATLATWVGLHRRGIYTPVLGGGGERWMCQLCQCEVNCYRPSYSGHKRLLKHEESNRSRHIANEDASTPCPGVLLGTGTGLDFIQQSVKEYVASGCLQCKGEFKGCTFAFKEETVVLKHEDCPGRHTGGDPCPMCLKLGNTKEVHEHICLWSWRLQMVAYAKKLSLAPAQEAQCMLEEMWDRDFAQMKMARNEMEQILPLPARSQFMVIKRKLEAIPAYRRTDRLHAWILGVLQALPSQDAYSDDEKVLYQQLSQGFVEALHEGRVRDDDLRLAAKVASGKLAGHTAIAYLFHAFFDMEAKKARGLERETAQELIWLLGSGSGARDAVKLFGVNLPKQTALNFESSLVPKPFLAIRHSQQLDASVRLVRDRLGIPRTRSWFVALDETYWRESYEQVSGLLRSEEGLPVVVGGGFHEEPEHCFAELPANNLRNLPQSKLAKMTVHAIVCRSDGHKEAWDVSMTPMLPGPSSSSGDKAELFVTVLGQTLQAMTEAAGLPPFGFAVDGGSSNYLARKLAMGLEPLERHATKPFFKDCVHEPVRLGPFFPFSRLVHSPSGETILASLDALHVAKRLSCHHQSASRTPCWGASHCDLTTALQAGLPHRAYIVHDDMSDLQAAQRANPAHLKSRWSTFGHHGFALVFALLMWGTESGGQLSARSRFKALVTCYFLVMMNLQHTQLIYGERYLEYSLPRQTLRNLLHLCYLGILTTLYPGEKNRDSLRSNCFQEKVAEHHFGKLKSFFRGNASVAQALWATQRCHFEQLRSDFLLPEPFWSKVEMSDAKGLVEECFSEAACTLSWMVVGRAPDKIEDDFKPWFKSTGKTLLTQGLEENDAQEFTDFPEGYIEDCEEDEPGQEHALLESVEDIGWVDHVANKQALEQLLHGQAPPEVAGGGALVAEPEAKAAEKPESAVPTPAPDGAVVAQPEAEGAEKLESAVPTPAPDRAVVSAEIHEVRTWSDLLGLLKNLPEFDMTKDTSTVLSACLTRQAMMMPRIRALAAASALHGSVLSKASIKGTGHQCQSDWHALVHELSLARAATMSDGRRQSRAAGWMAVQDACQTAAGNEAGIAGELLVKTTHFRPLTNEENPQVLLYLGGDAEVHIGVTATVYRGALLKSTAASGSRRMRVTKPAVHSLPVSSCARLRVFRAQTVAGNARQYAVCSTSTAELLDPLGTVLGQLTPTSIAFDGFMDAALLVIRFSEKQVACISQVGAQPNLFVAKDVGEIPVPEVKHTIYSHRDFKPGVKGAENIVKYMSDLPSVFEKRGLKFLEQGCIRIGASQVRWDELIQQVPDYFDVVGVGCSSKESYGRLVLTRFLQFTADADGLQKLRKFVAEVREKAAPVPRAQRCSAMSSCIPAEVPFLGCT